jgi:hypothetical protein
VASGLTEVGQLPERLQGQFEAMRQASSDEDALPRGFANREHLGMSDFLSTEIA